MPQSPLAIIEVTQEAIDNMAEQFPNHTKRGRFVELSKSICSGLRPFSVHAMIFGPGVTLAAVATPVPDVDEEDYSEDPKPATDCEATSPAARVQSELLAYDGSKLSTDHPLIVAIRNWLPDCKIPRVITAAQRGYQGNAAADYLAEVAAKCDLWWNGTAFKSI